MKVFISWSGTGSQSQAIAEALRDWMPMVVQTVQPWMSTKMDSGVRWLEEINSNLLAHNFGILCITPENYGSPWLNFEAGALSMQLHGSGRLMPYVHGFSSLSDLGPPLGQFNSCQADKAGTRKLAETINNHSEYPQSETRFSQTFEQWWPLLEEKLELIANSQPAAVQNPAPQRSVDDKIDELTSTIRAMARNVELMSDTALGSISVLGRDAILQAVKRYSKRWMTVELANQIELSSTDTGQPLIYFPVETEMETAKIIMGTVHRATGARPSFDIYPF